jgi:hypothetical protein
VQWERKIWLASTATTAANDQQESSFKDWASYGQEKIKTAAGHKQNGLLQAAAHLATQPAGYAGVKYHPMDPIPVHLWGCPILQDELGLVKDWLTRLEIFADCQEE